jgi:alpha-ketoglutarate-dependent taurine dioxygenase
MGKNFLKVISYSAPEFTVDSFIADLKQYKIVHLKDVPNDVNYKEFYQDLVDKCGEILAVEEDINTGNSSNERWTDIRYDKENSFTFRHANTRQPLHTDAAYTNFDQDVNFFFCMENAEIGGATTFIDSVELLYILEKYEPALLEKLKTTEVNFGKGGNQFKRRKIIDQDERGIKLNWNYYRVMPDNPEDVKALCEEFHNFLENRIVAAGLQQTVYLKPGEAALFQDDRLLHGRNSFYGNRNLIKGGFNFR